MQFAARIAGDGPQSGGGLVVTESPSPPRSSESTTSTLLSVASSAAEAKSFGASAALPTRFERWMLTKLQRKTSSMSGRTPARMPKPCTITALFAARNASAGPVAFVAVTSSRKTTPRLPTTRSVCGAAGPWRNARSPRIESDLPAPKPPIEIAGCEALVVRTVTFGPPTQRRVLLTPKGV